MMSQDDRLLPLSGVERGLDRPLRDPVPAKPYGVSPAEPTHLRDYMQVVLKRKWLILTLALVVTTLVTIYMYRQPNIYEAATTVQIEDQQSSILQTDKIIIDTGKSRDPAYWNTQLKLLSNPTLLRQVILTLDLQNNPSFWGAQNRSGLISTLRGVFSRQKPAEAVPAPPAKETALPVVSDAQPTGSEAATTSGEGGVPAIVSETQVKEQQLTPEQVSLLEPYENALAANLKVDPVPATNLVTLRFTHSSPELAQKVVNTLADVFVTNNLSRMTAGSNKSADLLANQIAQLQLKIQQEEEARLNYAKLHNLPLDDTAGPGGNGGTNLSNARLQALSQQLLEAENSRKNLQALYEGASRAKDPYTVPAIQEDRRVQDLRKQLDDLRQKRAELLVTYTPEWPDVKKIDEQIKPVEQALAKAPAEVIAGMKARYEDARAKEALLAQTFNQQAGENAQQNQAMIQMNVIKQQLATDQQYYNTLLQRQRELQITSNDRPNNVSVATYSRVPRAPVGPQRMRNVMIALLLSLGAGIGLAFLLDYLDDTVKTVDDVDRYIHVPALALIPAIRSERQRLKGKAALALPADENTAAALAVISDVRSPIAEAYRHLRTSLLLSSAGQPPKTILVTSSQPSEGKTTTAANIATTLAQTGAEVLIIDCDLRRPRIHVHFNASNMQGVTNYLSGESDLDALFQSFEKLPNLKVLASGPVPPNPAELLGSEEMRRLLHVLSERFTHIIIDSPPAISFTDASILSTMVDGVMLVVHGGRSSRAVVRRAKQQLIDVGANIFGVVLNNVKAEQTDYYYGGYYSHYYSDDGDDGPEEGVGAGAGARG